MKKRFLILSVMSGIILYITSCYNNKEDILSLPKVSFRKEIVPIMTSGACGCHNNENAGAINYRAIKFSFKDTIYYDAILGRAGLFKTWVNGGTHPGGGSIDFSANEKLIVKAWLDQGAKDDEGGCTVTGTLKFTRDILPVYNTSCKGSTCHGGLGPNLDYNRMVSTKNILLAMMNSGGSSGHTGGALSISACTATLFKEWINQGQPQ